MTYILTLCKSMHAKFKIELAHLLQPLNFKLSRHATSYITSEINSLGKSYLMLSENKVFRQNQDREIPTINLDSSVTKPQDYIRLSRLLENEGSDKSTRHSYSEIYCDIFMQLNSEPTIVEIGIGSSVPSNIGFMGKGYTAGASLRAWKSFFPDARIIGADIDETTLSPQDGLELKYVDQTQEDSLTEFSNFLGVQTCDLIIDDGLHTPLAGLNTFKALWPSLKPGGFYVIEDMSAPMAQFYLDLSRIFDDVSHKFFDMSAVRSRPTNCLSIYRKL